MPGQVPGSTQPHLPAGGKALDEELADLYYRTCEAADALHARASDIVALTERLEELTKGNDNAWYAGTRPRVEARATLAQAEELRRALVKLGERLSE